MSEPKITLAQIIAHVRARPTSPDMDLAELEFLDLPDSEQKSLLFRELVDISSKVNWIVAELQK